MVPSLTHWRKSKCPCEGIATRFQAESSKFIVATEIDLTFLFDDVLGSISLAEGMNPYEFIKIINRFYGVSSKMLFKRGIYADRRVGDQIIDITSPTMSEESTNSPSSKRPKLR